jgi:tetratricopeptide (TPR) repeat protein
MSAERYDELLRTAQEAYAEGRFEVSLAAAQEAELLALELGRTDLADRAACNCCPALAELDRLSEQVPRLQKALLRSAEPKTSWMAAYYAAMAYHIADQREQALAYLRRATDLVDEVGEPASTAATLNLFGNLSLLAGDFEAAETAYLETLHTYEEFEGYRRVMAAQIQDNLGYTHLCTDRVASGISLCEEARALMEEAQAAFLLHEPLQDLCYGYLLAGELDTARERGERGLELALEADDRRVVKNLLFLLAEVAVRSGDPFRARRYLRELAQYYPELEISEEMIDVLMAMDFTSAVNLRGS